MIDTRLPSLHLPPANLEWNAAGLPESSAYGDVYFSRADALGESSHVFLDGNELPARFTTLGSSDFIIGELGFGSGLNFLNTCQLWASTAAPGARLHYLACELHPLSRDELARLHAHWPALAGWSEALREQYPEHTAGIHQLRLQYADAQVLLTLLYGEAQELLSRLAQMLPSFVVDAWFLDGFSPRLNPTLWQQTLFAQLAALSGAHTTLATYSVAATVRQTLRDAGFMVAKAAGFAQKRHMLRGHYQGQESRVSTPARGRRHAAIVGGGLAGCSSAFALATSGWQVTLLEREAQLATQASGNPQGIVHFRPVKQQAPDSHFNLYAYLHATRYYRGLAASHGLNWHACGHLQLATTPALRKRFAAIVAEGLYPAGLLQWLDTAAASHRAGQPLQHPALFFPDSGWLSPPALCQLYTAHPNIRVQTLCEVSRFSQQPQGWSLHSNAATDDFDLVILANSAEAGLFPPLAHLPLISNRGQVDVYAAHEATQLHAVVCGQSYMVPGDDGVQSVGGSYFLGDETTTAIAARQRWHQAQLAAYSQTLAATLTTRPPLQQRSASRCITPDRLPLVGALDAQHYPGLYLNLAHGSHGLTRTPLCAAWLVSLINNTPPPCLPLLGALLSPARYQQ